MTKKEYYEEGKKIRIKYEIELLAEFIYLNYLYYNKNKKNINVKKIYNELSNPINYRQIEIDTIITKSKDLFNEKFNFNIN